MAGEIKCSISAFKKIRVITFTQLNNPVITSLQTALYKKDKIKELMTLNGVKIIALPKILDPRGNLSFIEEYNHIPFKIERTYWIYDVPGGQKRGGHAFREQQELVVALSGSFDVVIHDAKEEKRFHLNRSYVGLYIPNGLWRQMDNFSTNSVVLVLSSTAFDEADYIRDYNQFIKVANA